MRFTNLGKDISGSKYQNIADVNNGELDNTIAVVSVEALEIDNDFVDAAVVNGVVAGLESVAALAEASLANGGLDRTAAAFVENHAKGLLNSIGMEADDAVASMESFGGSGTREEATIVSVENIKEQAKNLWNWLVKKYKEIREKVFVWFKKTFSSAAGLKSRAQKIAKKAGESSGTKKDNAEDKIKLGSLAKYLVTGTAGKFAGKLKDDIGAMKSLADTIFVDHAKSTEKVVTETTDLIKAAAGFDWEKGTGFAEGGKLLGATAPSLENVKGDTAQGAFLGARTLINPPASGGNEVAQLSKYFSEATIKFEVAKGANGKALEIDDDQEADVLSTSDIKSIADAVADIADAVVAYESRYYKVKQGLDKMGDEAAKLSKKMDKLTLKSDGMAANKAVGEAYQMAERAASNPATQFTAAVLASGKAALDLCDKSLSQYA